MKENIIKQALCLLSLTALAHCLTYSINSQSEAERVVSDKFLSVALDCSNIEGRFSTFNLSNPNLAKLVSHLAPLYFRIGGTFADRIVFYDDQKKESASNLIATTNITFYGSDWLKVYQFIKRAGASLIFDLNSLLRCKDGSWNSENAEKMIEFSQKNGIATDWELGNEPDLYPALWSTSIDPTKLGSNYKKLRAILDKYPLYKSSYLVGPDMFNMDDFNSQKFLSQFLQAGSEAIEAVTWHHYYFAGKTAKEEMFLNLESFIYLEKVIKKVTPIVGKIKKIWLGETSTAYQGGAANMSDRFLATFLWLDKLGVSAKMGIDVVIRQTVFHDYYALLDDNYKPNPDWWVSVLYKKLVDRTVVPMNSDSTDNTKTRLYAHCAKTLGSSVVVFGANVDSTASVFQLNGFDFDDDVHYYEVTSEGSLYSQSVLLNGELLRILPDYDLPEFKPKIITKPDNYTMPAYSLGFWIFRNTNVTACKTSN